MIIRGGAEDTRLETNAKDTKKFEANAKDLGHRCKCSPKKKGPQNFFSGDLKKKCLQNFFSGKKGLQNFFSGDLYLRKPKKRSFADFLQGF